jgi:hypothetical protein
VARENLEVGHAMSGPFSVAVRGNPAPTVILKTTDERYPDMEKHLTALKGGEWFALSAPGQFGCSV